VADEASGLSLNAQQGQSIATNANKWLLEVIKWEVVWNYFNELASLKLFHYSSEFY
jgi:hypothetical protein